MQEYSLTNLGNGYFDIWFGNVCNFILNYCNTNNYYPILTNHVMLRTYPDGVCGMLSGYISVYNNSAGKPTYSIEIKGTVDISQKEMYNRERRFKWICKFILQM